MYFDNDGRDDDMKIVNDSDCWSQSLFQSSESYFDRDFQYCLSSLSKIQLIKLTENRMT